MPRFIGLRDAIRANLKESAQDFTPRIPAASPMAVLFGDQQIYRNENGTDQDFRWGLSTWGVESVTAQYKPNETKG